MSNERQALADERKPTALSKAVQVEMVSGVSIPKVAAEALDAVVRAADAYAAAGARRAAADAALVAAEGDQPRDDAQAIAAAIRSGDAPALPTSRVPEARREAEEAQRLVAAVTIARRALTEDAMQELVGNTAYRNRLTDTYAKAMGYAPKASDSWGEVQRKQSQAIDVAALIGSLHYDLEAASGGATPEELKLLRKLIAERPETLPTIVGIRSSRKERLAKEPAAIALAEAQRRKEVERLANREDARAAALARNPQPEEDEA